MMGWIFDNIWMTGGVILAILFIAHRLINNEKMEKWGYALTLWVLNRLFTLGKIISEFGRSKLGRKNYEMLEKASIAWGGAFFSGCKRAWNTPGIGLINGLMFDNLKNGEINGQTTDNRKSQ